MIWKNQLGELLTRYAYARFEKAAKSPEAAQKKVWKECLRAIGGGSFWTKKLGVAVGGLPTQVEDYPITSYTDYEAAISAAFGEPHSPLNGERVEDWAISSGTSGARKFFPVTASQYRQADRILLPVFHRLFRDYGGFFDGKILPHSAPSTGERSPLGVPVGLASTAAYRRSSRFLSWLLAIPLEIFQSREIFQKWGPLYAMAADVSGLLGLTPLGICRLFNAMTQHWELYKTILLHGSELPKELPRLRISKSRQATLLAFFEKTPRPQIGAPFPINQLWPKLRAVYCWKSSICAAQVPSLAAYFNPQTPILDCQYSATEGWFNVPLTDQLGGPLHLGAHLFEFLPLGSEAIANKLLKPWELQVGSEYEIVVSNAMGFIRYRIFDLVKCLGYFHRSPVISFQSKVQNIIRLEMAVVRESEVITALGRVGIPLDDKGVFAAAPNGDKLIFFLLTPSPFASPASGIAAALEEALREASPSYQRTRTEQTALPLEVLFLDPKNPLSLKIFPRSESHGIHAQEKVRIVWNLSPITSEELESLQLSPQKTIPLFSSSASPAGR